LIESGKGKGRLAGLISGLSGHGLTFSFDFPRNVKQCQKLLMPAIKTKAPCPVVHLCFQFAEGKNGNLHTQLSTTTRVYKLNSILEFLGEERKLAGEMPSDDDHGDSARPLSINQSEHKGYLREKFAWVHAALPATSQTICAACLFPSLRFSSRPSPGWFSYRGTMDTKRGGDNGSPLLSGWVEWSWLGPQTYGQKALENWLMFFAKTCFFAGKLSAYLVGSTG